MRTTLTLGPDVHASLNEASYRSGKSFKQTVDDAIRAGLRSGDSKARVAAPDWPCADLGVPLVDLMKAAALADELDDIEAAARMTRHLAA